MSEKKSEEEILEDVASIGEDLPEVEEAQESEEEVAADSVRLTTSGTCGWPNETTRSTLEPAATISPPTGLWLITRPAATVSLYS